MSKLSKKEIKELYGRQGMPKIKNPILYCYRSFMKIFFILFFGLGAVVLAILVFPFIRLFASRKKDFGIIARAYVSHTFRWFLKLLEIFCLTRNINEGKEVYRNIHSKIIVANHPSLLDFVYIMSLVPNSTCIVRGGLTKTPLRGVIKQAYITNTTTFEDMCAECKKITDVGCNVIVFPEGTRTPRHARNNYKKGAARIALYCGADVQPIFIGGSEKYGLGKYDPLFSFNHVERLVYDFKLLNPIHISDYKELSEPIAAKRLTDKMEEEILKAAEDYKKTSPYKTANNV